MRAPDQADLDRRFAFHPANTRERQDAHQTVRAACQATAEMIVETAPAGREQAVALTKLEEAMMWANAAIARQGGDEAPASESAPPPPTPKPGDRVRVIDESFVTFGRRGTVVDPGSDSGPFVKAVLDETANFESVTGLYVAGELELIERPPVAGASVEST